LVIKARVADLRALGQEQLKRHLHTRIGGHDMLLLESGGKGHLSGFEKAVLCLEDVHKAGQKKFYQPGQLIAVTLQSVRGDAIEVAPLLARSA